MRSSVLGLGAAVVGITLMLGGCAATAEGPKDAMQVDEEPSTAVEEPSQPETPAEPTLITEFTEYTWETFNEADPNAKRAYATYRIENNQDEHTKLIDGKKMSEWTETSIDMSDQAILGNFNYVLDEAYMTMGFDTQNRDHYLDHDEAIKILSGAYYNTDGDERISNSFVNARDFILSAEDAVLQADALTTVVSSSGVAEGVDFSGDPITYKDLLLVDYEGSQLTGRFVYVEFDGANDDDEITSSWLLMETRS